MKRFFALLLLGAMLFALMPFALAEDMKEMPGEAAAEETMYSASASSVQYANRVNNTATSIAFGELRRTLNTSSAPFLPVRDLELWLFLFWHP